MSRLELALGVGPEKRATAGNHSKLTAGDFSLWQQIRGRGSESDRSISTLRRPPLQGELDELAAAMSEVEIESGAAVVTLDMQPKR